MHHGAFEFVRRAVGKMELEGKRVLEIGSLDINSTAQSMSVRALCQDAKDYHGIDIRKGAGVDEVVDAANFDGKGKFDLVITTETLEHAAEPESIIACAERALCVGGRLILTAASPERQPHGWDGRGLAEGETYQSIAPAQLRAWLASWEQVRITHDETAGDVYAVAVKRAEPEKPEARREAKKGE
jgi:hypothetical protein